MMALQQITFSQGSVVAVCTHVGLRDVAYAKQYCCVADHLDILCQMLQNSDKVRGNESKLKWEHSCNTACSRN